MITKCSSLIFSELDMRPTLAYYEEKQPARNDSAAVFFLSFYSDVILNLHWSVVELRDDTKNTFLSVRGGEAHKKNDPQTRVRVCGGSLFSCLHLLNPTRTNCPGACQWWMKQIQRGGRELDRGDKEIPQICDLSCHTLTYKGNPGGDTHTKLATSDTVCGNTTLEI